MDLQNRDVDFADNFHSIEDLLVETDALQLDNSGIYNQDNEGTYSKSRPCIHLLDKEYSIEEDILDTPLEPVRTTYESITGKHGQGEPGLVSILRRESSSNGNDTSIDSSRSIAYRVSFPEDESLLAVYRAPATCFDWEITSDYTAEEILKIYQLACKRYKTVELDGIKNQILEVKNNRNHSAVLKLSSVEITVEVNETLEDVFKVCNFRTLILHECKFTTSTIAEFLNMIEYYESVCEIEVDTNIKEYETWRAFCVACGNISVLQSLDFKGIDFNEQVMAMIITTIKSNLNITTLKFDGCVLPQLPCFFLIENLMYNTTLRELYLPSTRLYTKEAECIGRFLQKNSHLKILDISYNLIGDRGLEVLAKGLVTQNVPGSGLSVFLVVNNQITEKSGPIISSIISECKNLHTLNIGCNNLTDQVIDDISNSLATTTTLEGLGMQSTLLTCKGMIALGAAIELNMSLQKINLKGNKAIQVAGVETLCNALTNSKIMKIEIDETNRSCSDPEAYAQMVKKLYAICTVNKSFVETIGEEEYSNISQLISRKISLSCEPRFLLPEVTTAYSATSPLSPSSALSSKTSKSSKKSRFQITKVSEPRANSRFKVTTVVPSVVPSPPPVECEEKNSVDGSPNDSVDSLDVHDTALNIDNVENE